VGYKGNNMIQLEEGKPLTEKHVCYHKDIRAVSCLLIS